MAATIAQLAPASVSATYRPLFDGNDRYLVTLHMPIHPYEGLSRPVPAHEIAHTVSLLLDDHVRLEAGQCDCARQLEGRYWS